MLLGQIKLTEAKSTKYVLTDRLGLAHTSLLHGCRNGSGSAAHCGMIDILCASGVDSRHKRGGRGLVQVKDVKVVRRHSAQGVGALF